MERVVGAERLYSNIKQLLEKKEDIAAIREQLGLVHLQILERDLFHIPNHGNYVKELEVYNKIAFYLMTKLTNFQYEDEVCLQGFEIAAFCFEVLCKSELYPEDETAEYGIFSSICYSLAENQANSIILARLVMKKCPDIEKDSGYTRLYAMFLAREFKIISRQKMTDDKLRNAVIAFSKSMVYRDGQHDDLDGLSEVLMKLKEAGSEHYYMFRLIFLVSEKMDSCSIRNLLSRNKSIKEYIDVLTQKEEHNVYELWKSQSFLFDMLEKIKTEKDIFFLSLPTSAGKTLISELILYQFLSGKKGIAIYVVPTIALTNEIENSFIRRFRKVGIQIQKELEFEEEFQFDKPVILILTPEKLDLLTRKQAELFEKLQCIVFDEFHKISDGQRGWLEETLIAWFIYNKSKYDYKIIMMSAIVDGLRESLADIEATVYDNKWTPSKKIYGMFYLPQNNVKVYGNNIGKQQTVYEEYHLRVKYAYKLNAEMKSVFQKVTYGKKRTNGKDAKRSDTKYDLCWKAVNTMKEETILVFFYTKRDMKGFISRCEKYREKYHDVRLQALTQTIARQLGKSHPLVNVLEYGVAFHNADLPEDVRAVIESAYKGKVIKVLACTTTLADGVNLPVSTLVIGSVFSLDKKRSLDLGDYKNIAGRIGRALVDTEGKIFLIKYPDIYKKEEKERLLKYYYGEKITNVLESSFDKCEENELEMIEQMGFDQLDKEQKSLRAMIERIQIFVFSLYEMMPDCDAEEFKEKYKSSFFLERSSKVEEMMDRYVSEYYGLAREIPFSFLQKCNKTGVSYDTNRTLCELAEKVNDLDEMQIMLPEHIYLELLECNEFLPEDERVDHYAAIQMWLQGSSYIAFREEIFREENDLQETTERCTKYIRRMFQYIVPWALSALLVYVDENSEAYSMISLLIRCVKYGTLDENVVLLCESGIKSRELAIDLNALYEEENGETDITDWVVNVQKEKLQNSFGDKFDRYILEQVAKYRSVKRELTHYFDKNRAIKCPVMGLKYYDYFKIGIEYFEDNKHVELIQDKENEYDMYAVKVMTYDRKYMLGHVPMKCSEEIYDIIESGYQLECTICEISGNRIKILIERVE